MNTPVETPSAPIAPGSPDKRPARLVCSEVWGGNRPIHVPVDLPGIHGVLFSQPAKGGRGGDVHYLSVCGSGIMARICLADVVGHGETVSRISSEMHAELRRQMNWPDERRVFRGLNRRLHRIGIDAMTTAAMVSYYPPRRKLSVSYAGHPPGWFFDKSEDRWRLLQVDRPTRAGGFVDGPLAIEENTRYSRHSVKVSHGDRLLLVTDGVLEAPNAQRQQFGPANIERVLNETNRDTVERVSDRLLDALLAHAGPAGLAHDDVTFVVAEFVPGPTLGEHIWLAFRNRLFPPPNELPQAASA